MLSEGGSPFASIAAFSCKSAGGIAVAWKDDGRMHTPAQDGVEKQRCTNAPTSGARASRLTTFTFMSRVLTRLQVENVQRNYNPFRTRVYHGIQVCAVVPLVLLGPVLGPRWVCFDDLVDTAVQHD